MHLPDVYVEHKTGKKGKNSQRSSLTDCVVEWRADPPSSAGSTVNEKDVTPECCDTRRTPGA
jgi:hypothetical protein